MRLSLEDFKDTIARIKIFESPAYSIWVQVNIDTNEIEYCLEPGYSWHNHIGCRFKDLSGLLDTINKEGE